MGKREMRRGVCGVVVVTMCLYVGQAASPAAAGLPAPGKAKAAAAPDLPASTMGHTHYLDYKNGFRGVAFGAPFAGMGELVLVAEDGPCKFYRKAAEDLKLGNVELAEVTYSFISDKLMGVTLHTKGLAQGRALLKVFETAFGRGAQVQRGVELYRWRGQIANARYSEDQKTGDAEGWIGNNTLQDGYETFEHQMIVKAAESL